MIEIQDLQNTYQKARAEGVNYVNEYWKEPEEPGRNQKNQEELN